MSVTSLTPAAASPTDDRSQGTALCLSGGGFRATLFHLGALRRLNELGILSKLAVVTSVSGGSILNGLLAAAWNSLIPGANGVLDGFEQNVAQPIRCFCAYDLRTRLVLGTRLNPFNWIRLARDYFAVSADFLAVQYERLYGTKRLADVPAGDQGTPRFVFCATNVQTGACWHFHTGPKARMGDFYTGYIDVGETRIATAVAASSAFPPGFAALRLPISDPAAFSRLDPWGQERSASRKVPPVPLAARRHIQLTDGGVYDNLGLEPVWSGYRSLLISDAGHPFDTTIPGSQLITSRLQRAFDVSANQVGSVRKRWLVERMQGPGSDRYRGAIWGIDTLIDEYGLAETGGYSGDARRLLAAVRTDLNAFTEGEITCLENHGYALADAAVRSRAPHLIPGPAEKIPWPLNDWCDPQRVQVALSGSHRRGLLRDAVRFLFNPRTYRSRAATA